MYIVSIQLKLVFNVNSKVFLVFFELYGKEMVFGSIRLNRISLIILEELIVFFFLVY